jgi:hypothetical protein
MVVSLLSANECYWVSGCDVGEDRSLRSEPADGKSCRSSYSNRIDFGPGSAPRSARFTRSGVTETFETAPEHQDSIRLSLFQFLA